MESWTKIVALLRVLYPFPDLGDATARVKWELGIVPPADDLVFGLIGQLKANGTAEIPLPGGSVISIYDRGDGVFAMSDDHQGLFCCAAASELAADAPQANGKWLEKLKILLPLILQFLPLIISVTPSPTPTPSPKPVV